MAKNARRRLGALGLATAVAVAGWQLAEQAGMGPGAGAGGVEQIATVRWVPNLAWWRTTTTTRPRVTTTTTVRPTTTTTRPPTTTTVRPTTTTTRPPTTTTVRPTTTTTRPPTTTTAPPAPPTTVAPAPGSPSTAALNDLVARVNARRATGTTCGGVAYPAVPALALQSNLNAAAQAHARDMATYGYFSHTGRDGSDPGIRMTRAGYRWSAWAENIAAGQATPAIVVDGWFASAGHCKNFMSSAVTQVGFGWVVDPAAPYVNYWVADLGRPG